MAVNIIKTTGATNTVPKHHRSDKSSQSNTLADVDTGDLIVPRFIYSRLSNFSDAKVISKPAIMSENNEYSFFLMELEEFYATGVDTNNIALIDEYLGNLGVSEEYPFLRDAYTVEPWVTIYAQEESRNVAALGEDIIYNVVVNVDGVKHNVIHNVLF